MAVTSTNNLRKGSSGDDVLELQKLLNGTGNGYNLAEDGKFGSNTLAAVKDYQQRNGLDVDGIVGTKTWGSLTGGNTATTPEQTAPTTPAWEYTPYTPSDAVRQAEELLQQQMGNKPGPYTSPWQDQLAATLDKILNREPFKYDLNGDMLYQQYKDRATTQGKMAMMDTMGQAAAMTGGYGNSYAQSVGQQAYQGQLQQLNDMIPELYQLALNQYNAEGDSLRDQASIMAEMESQDYGRHRDQMSDYYTELDRLTNDSRYQAEQEYGKWADEQGFRYQQERDKVSDAQWQAQFDEAKRQYDEQMALSKSGSSGGRRSSGGNYDLDSIKALPQGAATVVGGVLNGALSNFKNGLQDQAENRDYNWVKAKVSQYVQDAAQDASKQRTLKSDMNKFLTAAYQEGYITEEQYKDLKGNYSPRGLTY